jgi:hypothetical protein
MMKKHAFKLAMTGALAIASGHVIAIGFESLPTTGFSVSGETSAYNEEQ